MKTLLKDKLLMANFLSNLFFSFSFPTIHCFLINNINQRIISLNSIVTCISGILFPIIWNKYSDKLYVKWRYLLSAETIAYTIAIMLMLFGKINGRIYYFVDTLFFAVITKNIICGNNKLKSIRYAKDNEREQYDNNCNIVTNCSSLIGFGTSFLFNMQIKIVFILFLRSEERR